MTQSQTKKKLDKICQKIGHFSSISRWK